MAVTKSLRLPHPTLFRRGKRNSVTGVQERLESRVGKVPIIGRYHGPSSHMEHEYKLSGKVLGTGCNGAVRLATRKGQPQQKFAVKALALSSLPNAALERLKSEVENFLCMDHPHVTRLHDVYESETHMHLVMECLEGGELFDRVASCGRFSEADAAEAMWQMLLAVNYLHSHGIVHRDIKLENFLYDQKGGNHLKLIDFGFSKMWDPSIMMHGGIGTMAYMAPEVLDDCYTSQCDLWSLGVISFILLGGYMPFVGPDIMVNIQKGKYGWNPDKWSSVSKDAQSFMKGLLNVDPSLRLTAESALQHPWLTLRQKAAVGVDVGIVEALRGFGSLPAFRRCCLEMIAWVLSNEERSRVRSYFISMDANRQGTITLEELRQAMDALGISDEEVLEAFSKLDTNHDNEIHYSDFLAAMVSTKIDLHEDLVCAAFRRFDADGSGDISAQDLRVVLGETFEGECMEALLREADIDCDNRITYPEFAAYLLDSQAPSTPSARSGKAGCGKDGLLGRRRTSRFFPKTSSIKTAVKGMFSAALCVGPSPR